MLEALKQIGEYAMDSGLVAGRRRFLSLGVLKDRVDKLVVVSFKTGSGKIQYDKTYFEEYDEEKGEKCLYSGGPPNGCDLTPSSRITDKETPKTYERMKNWFETYGDKNQTLSVIGSEYSQKRVEDDIMEKIKDLGDENGLLTVKLGEKYLNEIEGVGAILEEAFYENFQKKGVVSKGEGVCCLCGKEKNLVGFGFPYSFYTVDKKGFAQGFKPENSYKMLPLDIECATKLYVGKDFVEKYLRYRFYGNRLYVYPKFITAKTKDRVMKKIVELERLKVEHYDKGLLTEEENFSEMIKDEKDHLTLIFMIGSEKGGGKYLDVNKYMESVLPSWINKLYTGLKNVYQLEMFSEGELIKLGKLGKEPGHFRNYLKNKKRPEFSLTSILTSTEKQPARGFFNGYDMLSSLISGNPITESALISAADSKFKYAYKQGWNTVLTELALKSVLLIKLMKYLEDEKMPDGDVEGLLDTPGKKAAFYEGVLVGHLMYAQYKRLKNTPFEKKLYGLNMTVDRIKERYKDVISKLRQYQKAYPELESKASENMIIAEKEGWGIKPEEAGYYFTLGYTLHTKFYETKEDEKND